MPEEASTSNDIAGPSATADVDVWSMTPQRATEVLAQRSAQFDAARAASAEAVRDASDAEWRLAQLTSDPSWVKRFMSGSVAERAEYQQLTETVAAAADETGTYRWETLKPWWVTTPFADGI
jgi:hypothetical protein